MAFLQLSDKSSAQVFGELVAQLYHHSQGASLDEFKHGCYQAINAHIPLGVCVWQHRSALAETVNCFSKTIEIFPPGEALPVVSLAEDLSHIRATEHLIPMLNLAVPNAMGCLKVSHETHAEHLFVFSPAKETTFSEKQLTELNLLMSHLIDAYRLNRLASLKREPVRSFYVTLECDLEGNLIGDCTEFWRLLNSPPRNRLPKGLPLSVGFLSYGDAFIKIDREMDIWYLRVMSTKFLDDALSKKELEVCFYLKQAISNQEMAEKMGISRKTVENHLSNIYRKCGEISRSELFALLHRY